MKKKRKKSALLSRRTKVMLHLTILAFIFWALWTEAGSLADWSFFVLGVVVEVS